MNISNAVLFGLKDDLKLVGNQYSVALVIMAYFMAYLSDLFADASSKQWMNSLVLGKVGHGGYHRMGTHIQMH